MINVVIPMAGAGSRFAEAGYAVPKPFIDVLGRPMIEVVLENLSIPDARYILLARVEHLHERAGDFQRLRQRFPIKVIAIDRLTEGAACTILHAVRHIDSMEPLLMANSDQLVDIALADYVHDCSVRGLDGSILTFFSEDPKWSYAQTDAAGLVTATKEKQLISTHATAGIYYFSRGRDFVHAAVEMIAHNDRTNNEFYVCPAYNYAIAAGGRFGKYEIAEQQMHGLGTPADLEEYVSQHAAAQAAAA